MSAESGPLPPGGETLRAGCLTICLLDGEAPTRFAAAELARYLPRLAPNAELGVYLGPPGPSAAVAGLPGPEPPGEGAIVVRGDGRRYLASGGSPAATLHAAYALLEALGARWVGPGAQGEVVGPLDAPPPPLSLVSVPAFSRRGLGESCLSWWPQGAPYAEWLEETLALVDWMGKMRMNRLFVHFNRLPPGDLSPLLPELERRGIALALGGHNLPKMLPPGLREAEPELCRLHRGVRRPDGNFCTSNPRLLRLLSEGARRYAESLPPAALYHLWPYDAKEDPWCSCPHCRALPSGEQMWRAVAAAAEGVAAARPGARVSGLLYHESLGQRPSSTLPAGHHGIGAPQEASFAPRERCYLHSLDGDCPRNQRYAAQLAEAAAAWDGSLSAMEYYADPILLGRPANRPAVVASDLAAYRAAGVRGISVIVFGALSWWLYPVQLYACARAAWDPASAEAAAADYCRSVAGEGGADLLARYYRLEGEAAGTHLRFCGYGPDGSWATLPFGPGVPPDQARLHRAEMARGREILAEARGLLERAAGAGHRRTLLLQAEAARRLEESVHRAVAGRLDLALGGDDDREAFAAAAAAMESAPPGATGVFGAHWMQPWLRRCAEAGHEAQP